MTPVIAPAFISSTKGPTAPEPGLCDALAAEAEGSGKHELAGRWRNIATAARIALLSDPKALLAGTRLEALTALREIERLAEVLPRREKKTVLKFAGQLRANVLRADFSATKAEG